MKNTIIASIVAVLCTAAICVTYGVTANKKADASQNPSAVAVADAQYLNEDEAADYLGIPTELLQIMRAKFNKFNGCYMTYYYTDEKGEDVTLVVYSKDELDKNMEEIMKTVKQYDMRSFQTTEKAK